MKKLITIIVFIVLILSISACNNEDSTNGSVKSSSQESSSQTSSSTTKSTTTPVDTKELDSSESLASVSYLASTLLDSFEAMNDVAHQTYY